MPEFYIIFARKNEQKTLMLHNICPKTLTRCPNFTRSLPEKIIFQFVCVWGVYAHPSAPCLLRIWPLWSKLTRNTVSQSQVSNRNYYAVLRCLDYTLRCRHHNVFPTPTESDNARWRISMLWKCTAAFLDDARYARLLLTSWSTCYIRSATEAASSV